MKRFWFWEDYLLSAVVNCCIDDAIIHMKGPQGKKEQKWAFFFEDLQSGILIKKNWVWRIRDANFGLKLAWMIDYGWIRLCTFWGPADNQRLGIYVLPYKRAFGLARKCQHWRIDSTILYGQEVGHIPSADDNYRNFIRPWRCTTRSKTVRMAPPAVAAGRIGIQCYIQHVPGKSWWWRRRNHTGDNKVHSIAPLKWHRCGHGTFLPRVRHKKLN